MTADPWDLPGPSAFLEETLEALRSGASLLVQFPEHAPEGYREATRRAMGREGILAFTEVEAGGDRPVTAIATAFGWEAEGAWLRSPAVLAESRRLEGRLVWVTGVDANQWPAWRDFIDRFGHACRGFHAGDCGQICLELPGSLPAREPATDPVLRHLAWRDRLTRLDVMLFLGRGMARAGRMAFERELRLALAVEVAGFDLGLAASLVRAPLATLLEPTRALRTEAERRGWTTRRMGDGWSTGREDDLEGRPFEHPASLAADGKVEVITRRVWRAELSVIFPVLEERRIEIVKKLGNKLKPMQTDFGYVSRVEDLELGSIAYQVRKFQLGRTLEEKLVHMAELRNALAHMEPVKPENLVGAGLLDRSALAAPGMAA